MADGEGHPAGDAPGPGVPRARKVRRPAGGSPTEDAAGPVARQRSVPGLAPWAMAWRTESPVEAARIQDHLAEHGIRSSTSVEVLRHAAMGAIEYVAVHVPSPDVQVAIGLIERRPDLFPAATSYSEPLRYSRGMWGRVRHAGPAAIAGYGCFVAVMGASALAVVVILVAMLIAEVT